MAQLLTCPNRHHWDLTAEPFAVLPQTRGLCPMCGEPPVADSPIDWDRDHWPVLVFASVLLFTLLLLLALVFLLARYESDPSAWAYGGFLAAIVISAWATTWAQQWWRRERVKAAALALGFTFAPTVSRARAVALGLPPFLIYPRLSVRRRNGLEGSYQGERVLLVDGFFRTASGGPFAPHTVAFFPEPIAGLPDFRLEPGSDETKRRNRSLEQFFGLRPLNPFRGEPFGRHYRLAHGDAEVVRPWLAPPLCDFLERNKGWVVGARQGRFYLYRPQGRCRADACATFIAVAWRLRQMLGPATDDEVAPPPRT